MHSQITKYSDQQGATLITAMMMLLVMTILSIAAVKMTSLDILIAGNDQQRMMLMKESESDLIELAQAVNLVTPLTTNVFEDGNTKYQVANANPLISTEITDMANQYSCEGVAGRAVSIGPDVPPCDLYDFEIKARKKNSGAREELHRGAGKEVPNPRKNSYLN